MRKLKLLLFICGITASSLYVKAQSNSTENDQLLVFLDCNAYCDIAYIKTKINYVDFVPDRFIANIYVMITAQRTGSGGQEIILYFTGQKSFLKKDDTLKFNRSSVATDDEYRADLVQYLKLGLTRYVATTSLATKLDITSIIKEGEIAINSTDNTKDPWNFWVMNISLNGNYSKDDYNKDYSYSTRLSANKTTEKIILENSVYYNKSFREITINSDKDVYANVGYGAISHIVKSLNNHWSIGYKSSYEYSTYSNYDYTLKFMPAIEYSLFPYKDAVKKAITAYYQVGGVWNKYLDTTFYNELNDNLIMHSLSVNFGFIQKWGNLSANFQWESFLNDFDLQGKKIQGIDVQKFSLGGDMEIRIFKGLSFWTSIWYDITKGIYPNIENGEVSAVDILSGIKQYPTTNSFYSYFGFNYRFGSIYNNVVNPRFSRRNN